MYIEQQPEAFERIQVPTKGISIRHNRLFPPSVRCIIAGPSGSGKTDLLLTLLLHENGLKYENIYICAKTLHQDKYKFLTDVLDKVPEIGFHLFDNVDDMNLSEIKDNSVVVFDDVITSPQNTIIRDIFSFGRHKCLDVVYLAQTLSKIPKHLIRDNANMYVLFNQDMRNLKNFYNDNISTDITFTEFLKICKHCWGKPFGSVVVNLECNKNDGRYRESFDKYIKL